MKIYCGCRDCDGTAQVTVSKWDCFQLEANGEKCGSGWNYGPALPLPLEPSLKVRNHSPTGFEFGYGGSGSAQLALAILLDCYIDATANNPVGQAERRYQDFKFEVIAKLPPKWELTSEQISKWLATKQPKGKHVPSLVFPAILMRDGEELPVDVEADFYPAVRAMHPSGPTPDEPAFVDIGHVKDRQGREVSVTGDELDVLTEQAWAERPDVDDWPPGAAEPCDDY